MSGSLMESIARRAAQLRVPLTAHLDLTYGCNERCGQCYLHHGSERELSTEAWADVLRQLSDAGTLFLLLSGGEILLRPDLFAIVREARRLSFTVRLKSNGTLITREVAEQLKHLKVNGVDISVYSVSRDIHDAITGLPGSLAKTLAGIAYLQQAGIRVRICNVLMRENAQDARAVHQMAVEKRLAYVLDPMVTPMIDGDLRVLKHRAEMVDIQRAFVEFGLSGRPGDDCEYESDDVLKAFPCSAGHSQVYINPCGQVFPCVQFPVLCGDVRKRPFAEIWKDSEGLARVRAVRFRDLPVCSGCVHKNYCTRCPGLALMEGDLLGTSSADCEKARVLAGIKPIPK